MLQAASHTEILLHRKEWGNGVRIHNFYMPLNPGVAVVKPGPGGRPRHRLLSAGSGAEPGHGPDYYVTAGSPRSGPIQVAGPGSTYSAPMAVLNQGTGLISVLVQGPSNSLDDYYITAGTPWSSAIQVGAAGSTYSAPGDVLNQTTGLISVLVQGPRSRLGCRHGRVDHFGCRGFTMSVSRQTGALLVIGAGVGLLAGKRPGAERAGQDRFPVASRRGRQRGVPALSAGLIGR